MSNSIRLGTKLQKLAFYQQGARAKRRSERWSSPSEYQKSLQTERFGAKTLKDAAEEKTTPSLGAGMRRKQAGGAWESLRGRGTKCSVQADAGGFVCRVVPNAVRIGEGRVKSVAPRLSRKPTLRGAQTRSPFTVSRAGGRARGGRGAIASRHLNGNRAESRAKGRAAADAAHLAVPTDTPIPPAHPFGCTPRRGRDERNWACECSCHFCPTQLLLSRRGLRLCLLSWKPGNGVVWLGGHWRECGRFSMAQLHGCQLRQPLWLAEKRSGPRCW